MPGSAYELTLHFDGDDRPFKRVVPPERVKLPVGDLADGRHVLQVRGPGEEGTDTVEHIEFFVRNGVAITVEGLSSRETVTGDIEVVVNAFGAASELHFEPRRAETTRPIPLWAWFLLMVIGAWSTYELLLAASQGAPPPQTSESRGARLFGDHCAKCHGADGGGGIAQTPLHGHHVHHQHDAALGDTLATLRKILEGTGYASAEREADERDLRMPAWGLRWEARDVVDVLNHVRALGDDGQPPIETRRRSPPARIRPLVEDLSLGYPAPTDSNVVWILGGAALKATEIATRLESKDHPAKDIAWAEYGEVIEDESIESGTLWLSFGRMHLKAEDGEAVFLRAYRVRDADCAVEFEFVRSLATPPVPAPPDRPVLPTAAWRYEDVQEFLDSLGGMLSNAGHGRFWNVPLAEFKEKRFRPYDKCPQGCRIPILGSTKGSETNLVRVLRDREPRVHVFYDDGSQGEIPVPRMPKRGNRMATDEEIAHLVEWIDSGMPE